MTFDRSDDQPPRRKLDRRAIPAELSSADVELLASVGLPQMPLFGFSEANQSEPLAAIHGRSLFRLVGTDDNTVIWLDVATGEVLARQCDHLDPNRATHELTVNSTLTAFLACCSRFRTRVG